MKRRYFVLAQLGIMLSISFFAVKIFAQNINSTNFQVENPHFLLEGGLSSSTSFQYFSGTGEIATGEGVGTSFMNRAGFLYFPIATSPVLSVTPGDAEVQLSWTGATGILANVTSYEVGMSTSENGTYVYTSVGNVLSHVQTGLSNGFTYYFKIKSYASGIVLSESGVLSAQPVVVDNGGGGGGGGGGSGSSNANTEVVVFGKAYPSSRISLLKDGQVAATTIAAADANFSVRITGMAPGRYTFGCYAIDVNGIKSPLQSFPVTVTEGVAVSVGSIFIAPTITGDKSQVKQGDDITFFGQTTPSSEVTLSVHSAQEIFTRVITDRNGVYLHSFDSSPLEIGDHAAKSKVVASGQVSTYGDIFNFKVGTENISLQNTKPCPAKADLNSDCKVNLVDFSIAAYWYQRVLSNAAISFERLKLNNDGRINLIDFSIMAYHWTG